MKMIFHPFTVRSGGVVRLSISPSQGEDHGFESRPEHSRLIFHTQFGQHSPSHKGASPVKG